MKKEDNKDESDYKLKAEADFKKELSTFNHEFRNQLNSIAILSHVLAKDAKDRLGEDELEYLELIESGAKKLLDYVMDLVARTRTQMKEEEERALKVRSSPLPGNSRKKILIIEDDPDTIRIIMALLGNDYEVSHALNGRSGLQLALEIIPDLIILDINLPVFDGFTVLSRIRKIEGVSGIPVIALTVHSEEGKRFIESGFSGYMSKPIRIDEFKQIISKWLSDKK